MTYLLAADLNALGDKTKLIFIDPVDSGEEASVVTEVFAQVGQVYDTTVWTDGTNTPKLVKSILAMFYVGWHYQKVYSEDDNPNAFGILLIQRGQRLVDGIVQGSLDLPDVTVPAKNPDTPEFYPTDASSQLDPTMYDTSLGGPMFSMGKVF